MIRAVAAMLLLGACAVGVLRFVGTLATVESVRVAGELTRAQSREVEATIAETLARSKFTSADDVARAVAGLGWVREVQVRRQWPDTLHVRIGRETLAARWGDGDSYLTTGGDIVPLPSDARDPEQRPLPLLNTSNASSAEAMELNTSLNEIARSASLTLAGLEQDEAGNWIATVADGVPVVLGASGLRERFGRFLVVYRHGIGERMADVALVDARYETGVAVRWTPSAASEPAPRRPVERGTTVADSAGESAASQDAA